MNENLTIIAQTLVKQGKEAEAELAMTNLVQQTRSEEGCLAYTLHQDIKNPCFFLIYETWENRELWQKHMQSPHLIEYRKIVTSLIEDSKIFEMNRIE